MKRLIMLYITIIAEGLIILAHMHACMYIYNLRACAS